MSDPTLAEAMAVVPKLAENHPLTRPKVYKTAVPDSRPFIAFDTYPPQYVENVPHSRYSGTAVVMADVLLADTLQDGYEVLVLAALYQADPTPRHKSPHVSHLPLVNALIERQGRPEWPSACGRVFPLFHVGGPDQDGGWPSVRMRRSRRNPAPFVTAMDCVKAAMAAYREIAEHPVWAFTMDPAGYSPIVYELPWLLGDDDARRWEKRKAELNEAMSRVWS